MRPNIVPTVFTARDEVSSKVKAMQNSVSSFSAQASAKFANAGKSAYSVGRKAAIAGAVVAAPLVLMAKSAVDYEDKLADIGKTTGLAGADLTKFGDEILKMSTKTRSSVDDIATIAEIGGRLGIAKKDLAGFTREADKFAVALGGDFSGGVESAITEFGKLKNLFSDTKDLDVSESLKKSGSAFNALSAKGVNVEGLTDFSLRVGALPEVLRPTLASSAALGATLQKSGVDAQIAASGFSNFLTTAGQNLPAFAKQMGLSTQEAQKLYNSDSATFFANFSASLKGVPADQLAVKLKNLKLNSLEVQKAVGGLSGAQDTYNELLRISNQQMKQGTSLLDEYNTKNGSSAARLAQLKNTAQALSIKLGQALLPVLNSLMETVTPIVQNVSDWISRNRALTGTIVKIAAGVAAAAAGISALAFVIGTVQKGLAIAQIAMKAFSLISATALGPIGLIITGVALAGAALYALSGSLKGAASAQDLANEVNDEALVKTRAQRVELQQHFDTLRRAKQGTDEYKTALSAIDAIQPGLTAKYNLQTKSIHALNAAERESIALIMERAKAEIAREKAKGKLMEAQEARDDSTGWGRKFSTVGRNIGAFFSGRDEKTAEEYAEIDARNSEREAKILYQQADGSEQKATQMQAADPAAANAELMRQVLNITVNVDKDGNQSVSQNSSGNGSIASLLPKLKNNL